MAVLRGDRDLIGGLSRLENVTASGLDSVARESLAPMQEQIRLNALRLRQPGKRPAGGHLDEGVVTRKVTSRGKTFRLFWISLVRRARSIGHMVELGTAPHWQPHRRGGIMHPGARPKPYFAPGFESKKDDVVNAIARRTWATITSAIRYVRH